MPENGKSGIIGTVLAYVDRPWKLFSVIALFIVGGLGWTLYQSRDEIIEAWLTPSEVELKTSDVAPALEKLVEDVDADLIQVWAVDLGSNSQRFLAARRKDGERPFIPSPRRLPVMTTASDVEALVNIMNGHPACLAPDDKATALMRRLADRGMVWVCGIPIPPSPEAFVGVIYLAWQTKPSETDENSALVAAREVSGQLVKR
jgi:hypothetical protein